MVNEVRRAAGAYRTTGWRRRAERNTEQVARERERERPRRTDADPHPGDPLSLLIQPLLNQCLYIYISLSLSLSLSCLGTLCTYGLRGAGVVDKEEEEETRGMDNKSLENKKRRGRRIAGGRCVPERRAGRPRAISKRT